MSKKRKIMDPSGPVAYSNGKFFVYYNGQYHLYRDRTAMWTARIALILSVLALIVVVTQ